ncbi:MAG TPA: hypothetical protein VEM41_10750 [Actinomycetota bacterium]|nr:hypothetical protein [Actinomycetota bacterium]
MTGDAGDPTPVPSPGPDPVDGGAVNDPPRDSGLSGFWSHESTRRVARALALGVGLGVFLVCAARR